MISIWSVPRGYKRDEVYSLVSCYSVCEEKTRRLA
jgi:hypothetical protein